MTGFDAMNRAFLRHGARPFASRAAYKRATAAEFRRAGVVPVKAQYDTAGNCTVCGEAGRCPGWHGSYEAGQFSCVCCAELTRRKSGLCAKCMAKVENLLVSLNAEGLVIPSKEDWEKVIATHEQQGEGAPEECPQPKPRKRGEG